MQRDGLLRQMQYLCSSGLLRNHQHPFRLLAVQNLHARNQTQVRALPQPRRSDEGHQVGSEVGARQLRALDSGSQHRLRREDGADHQDLQDPSEPLEPGVRALQGESRFLHPVLGEDLQGRLPRDLRVQARPGNESNN